MTRNNFRLYLTAILSGHFVEMPRDMATNFYRTATKEIRESINYETQGDTIVMTKKGTKDESCF